MIPLCCLDKIDYTDEDGTKWTFKPITGDLEREYIKMFKALEEDEEKAANMLNALFNKVVLKCCPKDKPDFFKKRKIGNMISIKEKMNVVIRIWQDANALSVDEKKT
jgi:hypothetical protein